MCGYENASNCMVVAMKIFENHRLNAFLSTFMSFQNCFFVCVFYIIIHHNIAYYYFDKVLTSCLSRGKKNKMFRLLIKQLWVYKSQCMRLISPASISYYFVPVP